MNAAATTSATACAPRLSPDRWDLRCPTCGHRPGQVTPTIAATVVRSLPRRLDHRRAAVNSDQLLADLVAQVRRHLADRAHRLLDGSLPLRRVDASRSGTDELLLVLADAIDAMMSSGSWPSDARSARAWGEVSHFVHDAVHHLRGLDGVLTAALPGLVDIDLDDLEGNGVGEVGGDDGSDEPAPADPHRA